MRVAKRPDAQAGGHASASDIGVDAWADNPTPALGSDVNVFFNLLKDSSEQVAVSHRLTDGETFGRQQSVLHAARGTPRRPLVASDMDSAGRTVSPS